MPFTRATKLEAKLCLASAAPSGAGKTCTALQLARPLGDRLPGLISNAARPASTPISLPLMALNSTPFSGTAAPAKTTRG
jgi:hypothetical protein